MISVRIKGWVDNLRGRTGEIRNKKRTRETEATALRSCPSATQVLFVFQLEREIPFDSKRIARLVSVWYFPRTDRVFAVGIFSKRYFCGCSIIFSLEYVDGNLKFIFLLLTLL